MKEKTTDTFNPRSIQSWPGILLISHEFLSWEPAPSEIAPLLYVCLHEDRSSSGGVSVTLDGTYRLYLGDKMIKEFSLGPPWSAAKGCHGILDCVDFWGAGDFRAHFYDRMKEALSEEAVIKFIEKEIQEYIRSSRDERIRALFGTFFQKYLRDKEQDSINEAFKKLDAMIGALKAHFVLTLPGVWAREDTVRMLLGGTVEASVVSGASYRAMLACGSLLICPSQDLQRLISGNASLPFWISPNRDAPTAVEGFGEVAEQQLSLLKEVLRKVNWESSEAGYHPILFTSIARLNAYESP